jgi:hypothetical protein
VLLVAKCLSGFTHFVILNPLNLLELRGRHPHMRSACASREIPATVSMGGSLSNESRTAWSATLMAAASPPTRGYTRQLFSST